MPEITIKVNDQASQKLKNIKDEARDVGASFEKMAKADPMAKMDKAMGRTETALVQLGDKMDKFIQSQQNVNKAINQGIESGKKQAEALRQEAKAYKDVIDERKKFIQQNQQLMRTAGTGSGYQTNTQAIQQRRQDAAMQEQSLRREKQLIEEANQIHQQAHAEKMRRAKELESRHQHQLDLIKQENQAFLNSQAEAAEKRKADMLKKTTTAREESINTLKEEKQAVEKVEDSYEELSRQLKRACAERENIQRMTQQEMQRSNRDYDKINKLHGIYGSLNLEIDELETRKYRLEKASLTSTQSIEKETNELREQRAWTEKLVEAEKRLAHAKMVAGRSKDYKLFGMTDDINSTLTITESARRSFVDANGVADIERAKRALNEATVMSKKFEKQNRKSESALRVFSGTFGKIIARYAMFMTSAAATLFVFQELKQFGEAIVRPFLEWEKAMAKLQGTVAGAAEHLGMFKQTAQAAVESGAMSYTEAINKITAFSKAGAGAHEAALKVYDEIYQKEQIFGNSIGTVFETLKVRLEQLIVVGGEAIAKVFTPLANWVNGVLATPREKANTAIDETIYKIAMLEDQIELLDDKIKKEPEAVFNKWLKNTFGVDIDGKGGAKDIVEQKRKELVELQKTLDKLNSDLDVMNRNLPTHPDNREPAYWEGRQKENIRNIKALDAYLDPDKVLKAQLDRSVKHYEDAANKIKATIEKLKEDTKENADALQLFPADPKIDGVPEFYEKAIKRRKELAIEAVGTARDEAAARVAVINQEYKERERIAKLLGWKITALDEEKNNKLNENAKSLAIKEKQILKERDDDIKTFYEQWAKTAKKAYEENTKIYETTDTFKEATKDTSEWEEALDFRDRIEKDYYNTIKGYSKEYKTWWLDEREKQYKKDLGYAEYYGKLIGLSEEERQKWTNQISEAYAREKWEFELSQARGFIDGFKAGIEELKGKYEDFSLFVGQKTREMVKGLENELSKTFRDVFDNLTEGDFIDYDAEIEGINKTTSALKEQKQYWQDKVAYYEQIVAQFPEYQSMLDQATDRLEDINGKIEDQEELYRVTAEKAEESYKNAFDAIGAAFEDLSKRILNAFVDLMAELAAKWAMQEFTKLFDGESPLGSLGGGILSIGGGIVGGIIDLIPGIGHTGVPIAEDERLWILQAGESVVPKDATAKIRKQAVAGGYWDKIVDAVHIVGSEDDIPKHHDGILDNPFTHLALLEKGELVLSDKEAQQILKNILQSNSSDGFNVRTGTYMDLLDKTSQVTEMINQQLTTAGRPEMPSRLEASIRNAVTNALVAKAKSLGLSGAMLGVMAMSNQNVTLGDAAKAFAANAFSPASIGSLLGGIITGSLQGYYGFDPAVSGIGHLVGSLVGTGLLGPLGSAVFGPLGAIVGEGIGDVLNIRTNENLRDVFEAAYGNIKGREALAGLAYDLKTQGITEAAVDRAKFEMDDIAHVIDATVPDMAPMTKQQVLKDALDHILHGKPIPLRPAYEQYPHLVPTIEGTSDDFGPSKGILGKIAGWLGNSAFGRGLESIKNTLSKFGDWVSDVFDKANKIDGNGDGTPDMYGWGGYKGLGIGNPKSYTRGGGDSGSDYGGIGGREGPEGPGGGHVGGYGGQFMALGGTVDPNKKYIVGEHGPELFIPDKPGQILSNATTRMEALSSASDSSADDQIVKIFEDIATDLIDVFKNDISENTGEAIHQIAENVKKMLDDGVFGDPIAEGLKNDMASAADKIKDLFDNSEFKDFFGEDVTEAMEKFKDIDWSKISAKDLVVMLDELGFAADTVFEVTDRWKSIEGKMDVSKLKELFDELGSDAMQSNLDAAAALWKRLNDEFDATLDPLAELRVQVKGLTEDFDKQLKLMEELGFNDEAINQISEKRKKMLQNLADENIWDVIDEMLNPMGDYEQSIKGVNDAFNEMKEKAEVLGLAEEDLVRIENNRIDALKKLQIAEVFGDENSIKNGLAGSLFEVMRDNGAQIGDEFAAQFQAQIEDSIGQYLAQTISDTIYSSVLEPFLSAISQAVMSIVTGGTVSGQAITLGGVMSAAALQQVVDQALQTAAAFKAILQDQSFKQAMVDIIEMLRGVMSSVAGILPTDPSAISKPAPVEVVRTPDVPYKSSVERTNDILDELNNTIDNIDKTIQSLMAGSLNVQTPTEKLAYMQGEYDKLLTAAKTGDSDAIKEFTGFASDYLGAAQEVHKSSETYQGIFNNVISDLESLKGSAQMQADLEAKKAEWDSKLSRYGLSYAKIVSGFNSGTSPEIYEQRLDSARIGYVEQFYSNPGIHIFGDPLDIGAYVAKYMRENQASLIVQADMARVNSGDSPKWMKKYFGWDLWSDASSRGYAGGGISSGAKSGHWEMLHGTEAVIPLERGNIPIDFGFDIRQLLTRATGRDDQIAEMIQKLLEITSQNSNLQIEVNVGNEKLTSYIQREADKVRVEANKRPGNEKIRLYH